MSVVIPTYNRARWLPSAVQSVLSQSHPPDEVIIIDDGSTDDTAAIAATFPPTVRYIQQENAGAAAARNRGIREAQCDYIAFQDSDDLWEPNKVEVQLRGLEQFPEAGWCISGFSVIDTDGRSTHEGPAFERHFSVFGEEGTSAEHFFKQHLQSATLAVGGQNHTAFIGDAFLPLFLGNFAFPQATMVRRQLLDRTGLFDTRYRYAEDTNFFHRLAREAPLLVIMTPLFRYRVGSYDSIIKPANTAALIEYSLRSLDENLAGAQADRPDATKFHQRGRDRLLLRLAYTHVSNYNLSAARTSLREAWKGGHRSLRLVTLWILTLIPRPVLKVVHGIKRTLATVRSVVLP